jgi:large subunit ribosomal protein L10
LNRSDKAAVIDEVAASIERAEAVFAIDYRGISVPQAADLRTRLREADAVFTVVKNTLTERAADQVGADGLKAYFAGPTAMTFVHGDAAAAAKALSDFRRANGGLLTFKGGWMNGSALTGEQVEAISRLPSRDVLYGQLVGLVASPLTGLAAGLSNLISGLARQLSQIAEQGLVPRAGGAPAAAAAPVAATEDPDAGPASTPSEPGPHPDPAPAEAPAETGGDPDAGPASTPEEPGPHPDPDPGAAAPTQS